MSEPLPDEEFTLHNAMNFQGPERFVEYKTEVWVYEPPPNGLYINVEFLSNNVVGPRLVVDAYFHPEDLERLGVLFQYMGQQTIALRDEKG